MERVQIKGEMLRWARDRSGLADEAFAKKFPQFDSWERGAKLPTLKQLQKFADGTYTPIGYLFLDQPPPEPLPIKDLRAGRSGHPGRPSPHLLDTIYRCQQRQEWFRHYATALDMQRIPFVGMISEPADLSSRAEEMRAQVSFSITDRRAAPNWTSAFSQFRSKIEDAGVLIVVNGIVGNDTHRKLDPDEFRGFALVDEFAPLIFVNGADTKAAQMFTLAHELAHLAIGSEGLSDAEPYPLSDQSDEAWCNQFAAEFLVPATIFADIYNPDAPIEDEMERLAKEFKVSTLVILRRIRDHGALSQETFWQKYDAELARLKLQIERKDTTGGNFYNSQAFRVGERFARAVIARTLEGQTTYVEALRLLDFSRIDTLHRYARHLGFRV